MQVVGVKQELWPIDTKLESEDAHRVVGFATAEHDGASRDRAKQDSKHTRKFSYMKLATSSYVTPVVYNR